MRVLIVESNPERGRLWARHLRREGREVALVAGQDAAVAALQAMPVGVIVLNVELAQGSALAVADFASYRQPDAAVIFVTGGSFFSDGSIFALSPNARAFVPARTPPEDLEAMVEHFGRAA